MSDVPQQLFYGIVYKHTLCIGIDEYHVLYNVSYIGQTRAQSRRGKSTPERLLDNRWKGHVNQSKNDPQELCFQGIIKLFGEDAFKHEILHEISRNLHVSDSEKEEFQKKLDDLEKEEIKIHGGIFKNPDKKIKQTFNLAPGGSGYKQYEILKAKSMLKFEKTFTKLEEYKKKNEDLFIPQDFKCKEDGFPLGSATSHIRSKDFVTSIEGVIERLDSIGFIWDVRKEQWEEYIQNLKEYYENNITKNIPQKYVCENGYKLGEKTSGVITLRKKSYHFYNEEQLIELGFIFDQNEYLYTQAWNKFLRAAQWYFPRHGKIGACQRTYRIPDTPDIDEDIRGYDLPGEIHKYRGNEMQYVKNNPERYEQLINLGYTKTSAEAGVDSRKRAGENRANNIWTNILPILKWWFNKLGHINLTQGSADPDNEELKKLLSKTNYSKSSQIISDLKNYRIVGKDVEKNKILKDFLFFNKSSDWENYKLKLALFEYLRNKSSYSDYVITSNKLIINSKNFPKFMKDYKFGMMLNNRIKRKCKFTENLLRNIIKKSS